MSTITTLNDGITGASFRGQVNTNFSNLNTDKAEKSGGTFTGDIIVPAEVYGAGWNGSNEVPTKNDLYDKIETMGGGGVTDHGALTGLADDDHTQYTKADGTRAFTGKQSYSSHPTFSADTELVDKKYVDDAVVAGGGYTDEQAQDAVGGILVDSSTIDFTYSDATPSITADIINDSVTFAKVQNISTNRILGRSTAGTGDVEELNVTAIPAIIGLGTSDSPQFTGVNIGHATDTTITRVSSGVIAVEGNNVLTTVAGTSVETSALKSATTTVDVSAATAPSSGQVLTATSSTTATWQTPSAGGSFKGCRVKQSTTQSVGTTLVAIAFNAETFDTDTMHDTVTNNTRITFTTAGYYQISGVFNSDANVVARAGLRLNGTTYIYESSVGNAGPSLSNGVTIASIYQFSASDYIEMMGYFGTTQNTKTGENGTHLAVARLG